MKVRKIKALKIARALANLAKHTPKFVSNDLGQTFQKLEPTPVQVKVVRKKDLEVVGWFSEMEAQAVIAKAKAQKKATLVIA